MDQSSCLEFFHGVVGIASPVKDVEGRPCGEAQAPPDARLGVEFELRRTRYRGSRHERVINVSALRQMTRHWEEVIDDVRGLREAYQSRYGLSVLDIGHLWRFGLIASSLPAFLLRRAKSPMHDGSLPADITAMFKAVQGVFMTTQHMIAMGRDFSEHVTTEEFLEHSDRFEIFNAPDGSRACSAPMTMLREFVSVVIDRDQRAPTQRVVDLIGDVEGFFRYGEQVICMTLARQMATAASRCLAEAMLEGLVDLDAPAEDVRSHIERYARALEQRQDGLSSEGCRRLVPVLAAVLRLEMGEACSFEVSIAETGEGDEPEGLQVTPRLSEWLQENVSGVSRSTADRISGWVSAGVALETRLLSTFNQIQGRIAAGLGRREGASLCRRDLFAIMPDLLAPIEGWLGIEIVADAGACSLRRSQASDVCPVGDGPLARDEVA